MKLKLPLVLVFLCCLAVSGQKTVSTPENDKQESIVKKQIAIDQLDNQSKDIQLVVVRAFLRSKIAEWLWKNGKDETGRAESLAVKVIDDLYANRSEIPSIYFSTIRSDIFALLEANSKDTARRLREKYKLNSEDELNDAHSLLEQKDGEKLVSSPLFLLPI